MKPCVTEVNAPSIDVIWLSFPLNGIVEEVCPGSWARACSIKDCTFMVAEGVVMWVESLTKQTSWSLVIHILMLLFRELTSSTILGFTFPKYNWCSTVFDNSFVTLIPNFCNSILSVFIDQLLDSDNCPFWFVSYGCFLLVCLFGLLDVIEIMNY